MTLSIGISPCPNDTYIFGGLALGRVPGPEFSFRLEDVETLNRLATEAALDVVKVSVAAAAGILDKYALLDCGGALGRGCGPLLVARPGMSLERLRDARIAGPGAATTATLLLRLTTLAQEENLVQTTYDQVMDMVAAGEADAGVVIHEGRFTYGGKGLDLLLDLGEWWETETGLPIPLGVIAIRRSLGQGTAQQVATAIRASLVFARHNEAAIWPYIVDHAQELSEVVIREHIATFVTPFSENLGSEGRHAVERLLVAAGWQGAGESVWV
jgi:1,4-dihydroxy-6-naphthoate synthase